MKKGMFILGGFLFLLSSFSNVPAQEEIMDGSDAVANAYLGDGHTDDLFNKLVSDGQSEIYNKSRYASYYFDNLRENFGNNLYGSCGYVSIGMLLSFYDSYWDDSIIPNSYDVDSTYSYERQQSADFDLVPTNTESPGIRFEPSGLFPNDDFDEYLNIAIQKKEDYFQFKLFDLAEERLGILSHAALKGDLGLSGKNICDLLDAYMHKYRNYSEKEAVINFYENSGDSSIKNKIAENLRGGKPMILIVKQPNSSNTHTVVAYDYDSITWTINVHPGWRNEENNTALTHVSLKDLGYTDIVCAIGLDFYAQKNIRAKYHSSNGGDDCDASTFIFPREIEMKSGDNIDLKPTFVWKSLYRERWVEDKKPYLNFAILDSNKIKIFQKTKLPGWKYMLTTSEWDEILFKTPGKKYYVLITLGSDSCHYWDDYWCMAEFEKPGFNTNKPYVAPNEYGFEDEYPTDDATKTNFQSHSVRGFTFETRRYRVGYIHNEDIVMSPIRKGVNEAFIEYRFGVALTRINVELSHWRELSNELLSNSNGTAVAQQFIGDRWVTVLDLLSEETGLPRNRNEKRIYKLEFSQPAYRVRFYSRYDGTYSSENNRGRICIGRMSFYTTKYKMPLSGSELDYQPEIWDSYQRRLNCYSYALNAQINPTTGTVQAMQPGQACKNEIRSEDLPDTDKVLSAIRGDAEALGFGFTEINGWERCPTGMYKVAFAIDNQDSAEDRCGYDYHWYRQNSDGSWSHKTGSAKVTNKDYSDKIIMDPRTCNRDKKGLHNYNLFVGYYAVYPLNTLC